jgi:glucose-6-phosphate 1-dehydrogenase
VEQAWRVVQPLLDHPQPVQPYAPGSWGPAAAAELVPGDTDWIPCGVVPPDHPTPPRP